MKTKPSLNKMLMGLMVLSPAAFAEDAFYEAVSSGKVKMDTRLRYETVEQDNALKDASGLTLRTRLGYETADLFKTKAYVEMSHVTTVGGIDSYNNPVDGTAGYSVIADPEITRLNQAYLKTKPVEGLTGTFGRQRIILDNARFVGNVGWRQTEQVFDALRVEYAIAGFKADVSYIWDIHNIFDASTETQDILVNLSYKTPVGKVTGYHYMNDPVDTDSDLTTTGLRFAGKTKVGDGFGVNYQAEYAMQEFTVGSASAEADYYHFSLGGTYKGIGLTVGNEVLGSDDGTYGFSTPLATKHAYNGWADVFLGTPAAGLNDLYYKVSGKAFGIKMAAIYHSYKEVDTDLDLGSEINLVIVKPFAKKYKVGLKYADYAAADEDTARTDTTKMWAFAEMKF